jgi:sporulation protein YunB
MATVDLLPTLAGLAGIPLSAEAANQMDGEDLSAGIIGSPVTRTKPLFWEYGRTATVPRPGTSDVDRSPILAMREGDYKDILSITYTSDGKVQGMVADSIKINLLCADVGARISEKLDALDRFYVEVDVGDVLDDIIIFGGFPYSFSADVVPVGGIETGIESEFLSAGINQTNYRLKMRVKVGVTAIMLITTSTIDISTTVSIAEMLIVGDVPTVYWG